MTYEEAKSLKPGTKVHCNGQLCTVRGVEKMPASWSTFIIHLSWAVEDGRTFEGSSIHHNCEVVQPRRTP